MVGYASNHKDAGSGAVWTGVGVVKVVRSRGNLAMHIYNFPWRKNLTGAVGDQTYNPFGFPLDRPTVGCQSPRSTRGGPCGFRLGCLVSHTATCCFFCAAHVPTRACAAHTLCMHRRETPVCPGSKDSLLGSHPSWTISRGPTTEPGTPWPLEAMPLCPGQET